jgi:hypothetical protein
MKRRDQSIRPEGVPVNLYEVTTSTAYNYGVYQHLGHLETQLGSWAGGWVCNV